MLAQNFQPTTVETPHLKAVSRKDTLFAELKALPDASARHRPVRIARKLEKREDFATYAAYRRSQELFIEIESL